MTSASAVRSSSAIRNPLRAERVPIELAKSVREALAAAGYPYVSKRVVPMLEEG